MVHRGAAALALGILLLGGAAPALATVDGVQAQAVIGQPDYTSKLCAVSQTAICAPGAIAFDPEGDLWVSNYNSSRVVEFPLVDGRISNVSSEVIGQAGYFSGACNDGLPGPTASTLCHPLGIAFDAKGDLWVVDVSNLRVLEFPARGGAVSTTASVVMGQPGMDDSGDVRCLYSQTPPSAGSLCYPAAVTFDRSGDLWVLDSIDNRALMFAPGPGGAFTAAQDGENASVVIGQPDYTSFDAGYDQKGLVDPYSLAFDSSGDLWVGDYDNCRALMFAPGASGTFGQSQDGEAATVVLGQAGFTGGNCRGPSQSRLSGAGGVAVDPRGDVWVSDTDGNRVLEFAPGQGGAFAPAQDGELASAVIGQENFTSTVCTTTRDGLCNPDGLAFDPSGNLWVVDYLNNRVMEFAVGSHPYPVEGAAAVIAALVVVASCAAVAQRRRR